MESYSGIPEPHTPPHENQEDLEGGTDQRELDAILSLNWMGT